MKAALAVAEIITLTGKPEAGTLPKKTYEALCERLEDAKDVACLNGSRKKPLHCRPLADVS